MKAVEQHRELNRQIKNKNQLKPFANTNNKYICIFCSVQTVAITPSTTQKHNNRVKH